MSKFIIFVLGLALVLFAASPAFANISYGSLNNQASDIEVVDGTIMVEGATADAYETTLAFTDPTADRTITFPNASGTVSLNPIGGNLEFEGDTADAFETQLAVVDPTADRTLTLPNSDGYVAVDTAGATTGNVLLETEIDASSELLALMDDETGTGALTFATNPTMVNPTIGNGATTAGAVILKEDSDNGTNTATLIGPASTTDVTLTLPAVTGTVMATTAAPGLTIANGANTACDTTCAAKACFIGFDAGASAFVACATATADTCVCGA
jgi:hypothetical protein